MGEGIMEENNFNFDIDTFVCPFLDAKDDHFEVQNTSSFFVWDGQNRKYKVTDEVKEQINENTVVFFDEVDETTPGYIADIQGCIEAIDEAQEPTPQPNENNDNGG